MDVGVCVASRVKDIDYVVLAERLGIQPCVDGRLTNALVGRLRKSRIGR